MPRIWADRLLYLLTLTTSWHLKSRCISGRSARSTTVVTLLDIMDFVSDGQYLGSQYGSYEKSMPRGLVHGVIGTPCTIHSRGGVCGGRGLKISLPPS